MIFYDIIILPLEYVFAWIFQFIYNGFPKAGAIGCIAGVSLAMNLLALPLYNIADRIQERERSIQKKLERWTLHIKRAFKGDERFMMLSEYYRQNNYHPIYALRSTLSILIQIPFFIAAYHYLRSSELLAGADFWLFKNLGAPDALIPIKLGAFSFSVNILPILMTAINCVSGTLYAKDAPLREKAQIYLLAAVFLALLYNSPSGLVIYWTLNNIFSLAKNAVKQYMREKQFPLAGKIAGGLSRLVSVIKAKLPVPPQPDFFLLAVSGLALAVLCGLLLPSSAIASSPIEFSFLGETDSPLSYIKTAFCVFLGFFVFWPIAIYKMFDKKTKTMLPILLFALLVCAVFNAYIFKANYGNIDITFSIENAKGLSAKNSFFALLNAELAAAIITCALIVKKKQKLLFISTAFCMGMGALGFMNIQRADRIYKEYAANLEKYSDRNDYLIEPVYHLSKTEKNVIVLFLDRGVGPFVSKIFDDYPAIKKQFDGFVWYPNTVSFAESTLTSAPSLYGGYEYTQEAINARVDELLVDKHTESQLVLAKLFLDAGYSATLTDPAEPSYSWAGDLSSYEREPDITVKEIEGRYIENYLNEKTLSTSDNADKTCRKQIVNFSVMQILQQDLRNGFYRQNIALSESAQISSLARHWLALFSHLYYLPNLTDFESQKGAYISMHSMAAHDVYKPLDDLEMPAKKSDKEYEWQEIHYLCDAAAFKQFGKFFDCLRQNGCWDNTRIILVSDHGIYQDVEVRHSKIMDARLAQWFSPMLLFKDFNANMPLQTNTAFMTSADTLFLAKEGLGLSETNPYTGKQLQTQKAGGVTVYECLDSNPETKKTDKVFAIDKTLAWHVLPGNISDLSNWIPLLEWEERQKNGGAK